MNRALFLMPQVSRESDFNRPHLIALNAAHDRFDSLSPRLIALSLLSNVTNCTHTSTYVCLPT